MGRLRPASLADLGQSIELAPRLQPTPSCGNSGACLRAYFQANDAAPRYRLAVPTTAEPSLAFPIAVANHSSPTIPRQPRTRPRTQRYSWFSSALPIRPSGATIQEFSAAPLASGPLSAARRGMATSSQGTKAGSPLPPSSIATGARGHESGSPSITPEGSVALEGGAGQEIINPTATHTTRLRVRAKHGVGRPGGRTPGDTELQLPADSSVRAIHGASPNSAATARLLRTNSLLNLAASRCPASYPWMLKMCRTCPGRNSAAACCHWWACAPWWEISWSPPAVPSTRRETSTGWAALGEDRPGSRFPCGERLGPGPWPRRPQLGLPLTSWAPTHARAHMAGPSFPWSPKTQGWP